MTISITGKTARLMLIIAIALAAMGVGMAHAEATSALAMPHQSGGSFSVPVASLKGLRFRDTVRQKFDFSCGSAALATLLTHHYDHPVSEQQVFADMYERGDKEKIQREGFSLLDMKLYLAARGFEADGYKADLEKLETARVPAIALIKERGYHHFVVVKGLLDDRVLIGDPAVGTRAMSRQQFEQLWVNGVLFVIRSEAERAQFNGKRDWTAAPKSPMDLGISSPVGDVLLLKRRSPDF
jgi:predicted double-glycine peptidase